METDVRHNTGSKVNKRLALPRALKYYESSDFNTQQKVRFIYYLCISVIIGLPILIASTAYVQINTPGYTGLYFPVLLPEISILILFIGCLFLLIRGFYSLSAHLLVILSLSCVWLVMVLDKGKPIIRLDTIAIVLAILTVIPLIVTKQKITILIYSVANIVILGFYLTLFRDQLAISDIEIIDYMVDTSVAIFFVGIIGFSIYSINKRSHDRAVSDTKERFAAELALEKSESKFKELTELLPQTVFETDLTGKFTYVNKTGFEIFGYADEDLHLGINLISVISPEDREIVLNNIKELLKGEFSTGNQYTGVKKDGSTFPIQIYSSVIIENQKPIGLRGIVIDITETINAEKEIKESESKYRNLFDNAQIGIYQTTPEGKILKSNPALIKMLGFDSIEELEKRDLEKENVYEDTSRKAFKELIEKNDIVVGLETKWKKKNGEIITIIENSRAVRDSNGKTLYYEGFVENITERKNAEELISRARSQLQGVLDAATEISIIATEPSGNIVVFNKGAEKMLGYKEDEVVGKKSPAFIHLESEVIACGVELSNESGRKIEGFDVFIALAMRHRSEVREWTYVCKDGSHITVNLSITAVRNEREEIIGYLGIAIDITEQKKADKSLKESEEKYPTLMESMNEVVIMADNNHKVQFVNKKFTEILGYTPEEIIGKIGYKILHDPKDFELIEKANEERIERITSQYELPFIAKDGRKIDFLVSGAPIFDSDGKTLGSIGAMIDITERKQADKALKDSQHLFETLAQMSPVGIFRTRADGYTTYVNPKWSELSGLTFEEALGDGWLKAVHPENKVLLYENWSFHSSKGEKSVAEYRFLKKDGSIVWVLGDTNPEIIDNEIKGFIGTLTDITERKQAEKELQASEERYRTIIDAFPDVIMISDLKGNIIFANEHLERTTGITPRDYSNPKRAAHIHPKDLHIVTNAVQEMMLGNKTHTGVIENRFIDSNGNTHWFSGIISKIIMNDQIMLQTITRDITEKKIIEKELEKYQNHLELLVKERTEELAATNEELTSTNEELYNQRKALEDALINLQNAQKQLVQAEKMASLGILSAGVAHEINNPLNFINGGIHGIESYFKDNLSEHIENVNPLIEAVNIGVNRAADIVKSLNRFSRQSESTNEKCDIHSIINNCLVMLNNETKDRIEIHKEFTDISFTLIGNEGKLHQVILNLLSNAIQAIDDKGTITLSTYLKDHAIFLKVHDTGQGIKKEYISRIFDPFFTTKEPGKGTGLGLAICYKIIQEFKGTIEVESEQGEGTSAIISLPIDL